MNPALGKADKLRTGKDFGYLRENGVKLVGRLMLLVYAPSPDGTLKAGVVCSRKYSKLAVKRNRARRLLWMSYRNLKPEIAPDIHLLLIPRMKLGEVKQPQAEAEMRVLLRKAAANIPPAKSAVAASAPEC